MYVPHRYLFVLGLILSLFVTSCGGAATPAPPPKAAERSARVEVAPAAQAVKGAPPQAPQPSGGEALQPIGDRMIIRTADVSIEVTDTQAAADQIKAIAESFKGYVSGSNFFRSNDLLQGTITIRVPATDFETAMARIKAVGLKVQGEKLAGEDVTEEFTDLSARRRNLEATEQELLKLLSEVREKSGKAEDILAVYRELTNIRGQIEQLQGRMQFLERMTALATINVELIPSEVAKPIVEPDWAPASTLREASRALVRTFQGLANVAIWLVVWGLPTLIVMLIPLGMVVWAFRRWRGSRVKKAT